MQECDLSVAEREEVVSPVGMEDGPLGEDHSVNGLSRQRPRKVVTVAAEGHPDPGVDVNERRCIGEGGVVGGRGDPGGVEASRRERADRYDRIADPAARVQLYLDVHLISPEEEQNLQRYATSALSHRLAPLSALFSHSAGESTTSGTHEEQARKGDTSQQLGVARHERPSALSLCRQFVVPRAAVKEDARRPLVRLPVEQLRYPQSRNPKIRAAGHAIAYRKARCVVAGGRQRWSKADELVLAFREEVTT